MCHVSMGFESDGGDLVDIHRSTTHCDSRRWQMSLVAIRVRPRLEYASGDMRLRR